MKSKTALKMACLSVGLATAWSPLGGQTAHAGTVVEVNLSIGTSPAHDPGPYSSVAMGLVFSDGSYEIDDLINPNSTDGSFASNNPDPYDIYFTTNSDLDITSYVVAGLTSNTPIDTNYPLTTGAHVMASIASLDGIGSDSWDQIFGESEATAASSVHDFLKTIISQPSEYTNVLDQDLNDSPSLYESTIAHGASGDVSIVSLEAVTVPLPNACLMGGGLFALMALSKRSFKWIQLRQTQSLA